MARHADRARARRSVQTWGLLRVRRPTARTVPQFMATGIDRRKVGCVPAAQVGEPHANAYGDPSFGVPRQARQGDRGATRSLAANDPRSPEGNPKTYGDAYADRARRVLR